MFTIAYLLFITSPVGALPRSEPPTGGQPAFTVQERCSLRMAAAGFSPAAAIAAGLTTEDVQGVLARLDDLHIVDQLLSVRPVSSDRRGLGTVFSEICSILPADKRNSLQRCRAAEAAGLPASWGLACETPAQLRAVVRAARIEARAVRLDRGVDAHARELLEQARGNRRVTEADGRVRDQGEVFRQVFAN